MSEIRKYVEGSEETCGVYVIAKKTGTILSSPVKVGMAEDAYSRLATLKTATPFDIECVVSFDFHTRDQARFIEREFHAANHASRLHGEWFDCSPEIAISNLCLIIRRNIYTVFGDDCPVDQALGFLGVPRAERRFSLTRREISA